MKKQTEAQIQTAVCKKLRDAGFFFWRSNNVPIFDPKLNNGYGAYRSQGEFSLKGIPDIIIILKGGQFCGLEVKTPTGSVSADQVLFERRCKTIGAKYIVIRSVEDINEFITHHASRV